jgi:hypothetical protein
LQSTSVLAWKYEYQLNCQEKSKFYNELIIYRFTSRSRFFSLIWRHQNFRWRAAKFRLMLGTQGLWAGRDLYRVTPAVKWYLGFSDLIRRTASFSRLLRNTMGCGGSVLTRSTSINLSQNEGLSLICIALSLDRFDSISWHSAWIFLPGSFTVFTIFFSGFSTCLAWASLKWLLWSKCASCASKLVLY